MASVENLLNIKKYIEMKEKNHISPLRDITFSKNSFWSFLFIFKGIYSKHIGKYGE